MTRFEARFSRDLNRNLEEFVRSFALDVSLCRQSVISMVPRLFDDVSNVNFRIRTEIFELALIATEHFALEIN